MTFACCFVMLAWNCQSFHDSNDSDEYTVVTFCLYREQLGIKVITQYLQYVVLGESDIYMTHDSHLS